VGSLVEIDIQRVGFTNSRTTTREFKAGHRLCFLQKRRSSAICTALVGSFRADAEPYAPAEKDLQKIIPLYEYKELDYLARLRTGVTPPKAKAEANAVAWNPASPLITEPAHFLTNAKVVIINYALLKQDFPFLAAKPPAEIDQWVLDKAAYIAKGQVEKGATTGVNTEIANRADKSGRWT
jgi:hypothetical protein